MSAGAGSEKPGWVDGVSVCGGWREWGGGQMGWEQIKEIPTYLFLSVTE